MPLLTEHDLERINRERAAKGLPPLTLAQARAAVEKASDQPRDDGFDWVTYLVLYELLSSDEAPNRGGQPTDELGFEPPFQGAGGTSGGGGASGDWTPPSDPTPAPESDGGGKGGDAPSYSDPAPSYDAPSDSGGGGGDSGGGGGDGGGGGGGE